MAAEQTSDAPALRVRLACAEQLVAPATWALEALLARAGVPDWELVQPPDGEVELELPHDPGSWEFAWDREPDAALDPLAATFWWLARVEELLAPARAFDEHGRFRFAASALARGGDPFATPVDDIALALPVQRWRSSAERSSWTIVPTHDVDLPWRWTRQGARRALRRLRDELRGREFVAALRTGLVLAMRPAWQLRRDDPWCNAHRIGRLERAHGARSTSYVLMASLAPQDGDPQLQLRGRQRYVGRIVGSAEDRARPGSDLVGLHGSYTSSGVAGQLVRERAELEALLGGPADDHRFHYLRHRPVEAWPQLDAAGFRTDSSLGFAEHPGFRAGTAHPFRAWDHGACAPLDLVVIPLVFMDASLDARYTGLGPGRAGAQLAERALAAVQRVGGSASVLFHNDRLCTLDTRAWTRLYRRMLRRVQECGGGAVTARSAAEAYRRRLPSRD